MGEVMGETGQETGDREGKDLTGVMGYGRGRKGKG